MTCLVDLHLSLVLDFEQLLSFDFCKTTFLFIFYWIFLSMIFGKKQRFPVKDLEVEHDFLKTVLPMVILIFFGRSQTSPKS